MKPETYTDAIYAVIGMHINDVPKVDFGSSYPVVNRETLIIEGVVDGNYPDDFNGGKWETASLVDGRVEVGEQYADFAVAVA